MVLVKADKNTEAGVMPSNELLTEMGKFNEDLVKAGIMQTGEGLHPTSRGTRVRFAGGNPQVTQGPFSLSESLVCGFWVWRVASMDEALEWAKRAPFPMDSDTELELRPIFEAEDFGEALTPELKANEERMRAELAAKASD